MTVHVPKYDKETGRVVGSKNEDLEQYLNVNVERRGRRPTFTFLREEKKKEQIYFV